MLTRLDKPFARSRQDTVTGGVTARLRKQGKMIQRRAQLVVTASRGLERGIVMRALLACLGIGSVLLAGCGAAAPGGDAAAPAGKPAASAPQPKPARPQAQSPAADKPAAGKPAASPAQPRAATNSPPPAARAIDPRAPLANLAAQAADEQFDPPAIDERRAAAAGIRKLAGKHITLYTDVPAGEVDELPAVFDAAVPRWAGDFGQQPAKIADWKIVGHVMRDKERFVGAGLFPASLPDFPNGFSTGPQLWLYDQPSGYYRRHLLLHEGTHCFMFRWLGGAGPPWYMEGMAELLATHRWEAGKLTLAVMPQRKEDVPYWGRVKIIRDEYAAGRGMTLDGVLRYDSHAHLRNEPYGWCWGAAAFFDQHPLTQAAFRELKRNTRDRTFDFSQRFKDRLKEHWPQISDDWQVFVIDCDYGYDFARAAVQRKPAVPLPAAGATVEVAADRGWQSTGYALEAGKSYAITASGRYDVAGGERPWPCEAGGITLRYHEGQPLGMLLGVVAGENAVAASLADKRTIGLESELTPSQSGTLYLSINEAASGLADNRGTLSVAIRSK